MKRFLALLCALLFALPTWAQDAEVPKELGFQFSFNHSPKTPVISAEVGYQRELPGVAAVPFDKTVAGARGLIESETLTFFDPRGTVLGTLTSSFDAEGHLKNQSLVQGESAPRALDWFKAGDQSPLLTLEGSALSARYSLQNGFLKERVLALELPAGPRQIKTTYDSMGRREHDTAAQGTENQGAVDFRYLYDTEGLTTMRGNAGSDNAPFEALIVRGKDGKSAQLTMKSDGVLGYRVTSLQDGQDGQSTKNIAKVEIFEDGILATAVTTDNNAKTVVTEQYNAGILAVRKTQATGEGGVRALSLEEFDDAGNVARRVEYGEDGAVSEITTYNPDGSVKSTRKLGADA